MVVRGRSKRSRRVDEAWRRHLAASLLAHGYYTWTDYRPDLSGATPVWLGGGSDHLAGVAYPLYHWLVSLLLRLPAVQHLDLAVQDRILRLFSLVLFLLTLGILRAIGRLLFGKHPLGWLIPLFLALLPGFVDVMTSVNDDVAAVFTVTAFLWVSLLLIRGGWTFPRGMLLLLVGVVAVFSKITTWPLVARVPLVWGIAWLKGTRWAWLPWLAMLFGSVGMAWWGISEDGLAHWYPLGFQREPFRLSTEKAPWGEHALCLVTDPAKKQYPALGSNSP